MRNVMQPDTGFFPDVHFASANIVLSLPSAKSAWRTRSRA
jgi:hypothetical protein